MEPIVWHVVSLLFSGLDSPGDLTPVQRRGHFWFAYEKLNVVLVRIFFFFHDSPSEHAIITALCIVKLAYKCQNTFWNCVSSQRMVSLNDGCWILFCRHLQSIEPLLQRHRFSFFFFIVTLWMSVVFFRNNVAHFTWLCQNAVLNLLEGKENKNEQEEALIIS